MIITSEQLTQWLRQEASWRLIGFMGEELVISLMEGAGYTVIKQKPYFVQLPSGLVDLGSKVDLQAIGEAGEVILIEVKSTSRDYEPRLSKAQLNLMGWCKRLNVPYIVASVKFRENEIEIPESIEEILKL